MRPRDPHEIQFDHEQAAKVGGKKKTTNIEASSENKTAGFLHRNNCEEYDYY